MKKLWNEEVLLVVLMDIKFHSFSASLEEFIFFKEENFITTQGKWRKS